MTLGRDSSQGELHIRNEQIEPVASSTKKISVETNTCTKLSRVIYYLDYGLRKFIESGVLRCFRGCHIYGACLPKHMRKCVCKHFSSEAKET